MKLYHQSYVDGRWVDPISSRPFDLVDPSTEQVFGQVSLASAADVDRAVVAARKAFSSFSATSRQERLDLLQRIVEVYVRRQDDILAAVSQEMGAPRSMRGHADAALAAFRQAIVTLSDYPFETRLGDNIVLREPIGVCGLITAWNWPVQLIAVKLSAAIAAGCTTVLKPSEFTPVSAIVLAEVLHEAGVPAGVFNLVNGDGPTAGHAISSHEDIDMVSFTGSTRAGILIAQAAAPTVKRVCQELGGKSANIILQDADLGAAARWNIGRCYSNSGQSCHAPSRVLVHESQHERFLELLQAEAAKVRVGDPRDPATTMGPVVNKAQYDRIQGYIRTGIEEGARLVCGGPGRPEGIKQGYYIRPTVFADVRPSMAIAQEEIFGPVIAVLSYASEDEAIQVANGTIYGLGGYVFTTNAESARRVAGKMRAGRIFLNGAPSNTVAPMGGYKRSGNGREMGVFGLEEYLEVKALIGFTEAD